MFFFNVGDIERHEVCCVGGLSKLCHKWVMHGQERLNNQKFRNRHE